MTRQSKKRKQVSSALEAQRKKWCHLRNEPDEGDGFDVNEDDGQNTSKKCENALFRLMEVSKTWTSNNQRSLAYVGNSRTTKWRRKVSMKKAAAQTPTLETFFINGNRKETFNELLDKDEFENINVEEDEEVEEVEEAEEEEIEEEKGALKFATRDLQNDIQRQGSPVLKLRLQSIYQYFNLLNKKWPKIKAAKAISEALGRGPNHAKNIRTWANNYIKFQTLPVIKIQHFEKLFFKFKILFTIY